MRPEALELVQNLHMQMARFARSVERAVSDGHVSLWDGMAIGKEATELGQSFLLLFQATPLEVRKDVLRVLEYGHWVMGD